MFVLTYCANDACAPELLLWHIFGVEVRDPFCSRLAILLVCEDVRHLAVRVCGLDGSMVLGWRGSGAIEMSAAANDLSNRAMRRVLELFVSATSSVVKVCSATSSGVCVQSSNNLIAAVFRLS